MILRQNAVIIYIYIYIIKLILKIAAFMIATKHSKNDTIYGVLSNI